MEIDLSKAIDNYCDECGAKKEKYIGKILGAQAVLYRFKCHCESLIARKIKSFGKSDKEVFDSLQIPFWRLMGQKAKPKDMVYEKRLKSRGMTYGDAVRERNHYQARNPSGLKQMQESQK